MIPSNPFILVDGSSYLYRAFHALPPLTNSKGQPTGAIYGVLNMLRKLLKDFQPEHVAVVFDAKGKTFRHELYKEYKAHRPPMPPELVTQIKPLHEVIRAMGIPLIMVEGVEADDVIGTLAMQAKEQNIHTLISTGDKDMAQLVNGQVTLINTMRDEISDAEAIRNKYGVTPAQIRDYLALIGDTSDNIPGIPNVGPKTAAKWLNEYGSLDAIEKNADKFGGKVGENLRNNLETLALSKTLVSIKLDVPLDFSIDDLKPQAKNFQQLKQYFTELEFKAWLKELLEDGGQENTPTPINYKTIFELAEFNDLLSALKGSEVFAFDTETTSLDSLRAELVGVSLAYKPNEAFYIPVGHDYAGAPTQLNRALVIDSLKPLLEDANLKKIAQNLKYDMEVMANYDVTLRGFVYDTMLESYVLNSTASRHDMDTLALKYLAHKTISFEDIAGKGSKQLTFNQIPIETAGPYAAEDADITLKLHQTLWPQLQQETKLASVFNEIEMPLVAVLAKIERNGVLIDANMLQKQSLSLTERLTEIKTQAFHLAGKEFNLDSPKQLQEILYEEQGLPILQKTPKGQPSTAEPVLQDLALDYPLPKCIIEYRSLNKLKTTYTDRLPEQINPQTGRVHTSFHQAVAATGRLSSSDPNLQNIPTRTEEGRRIRQAFIVPKGHKMVAADYSQIELRIMAHLSNDTTLLKAFANNWDVHKATASEIFSVALNDVSSEQRRKAKAINFGLIYGMSAFGLAKQIGVDRSSAQSYIDLYFARYPGVKEYMDNTRALAKKQGYVETLFGRRLYLPEINASNIQRQRAAERTAINAPMQGSAADIIKRAMIQMQYWIDHSPLDVTMVLQVHDELVFEVADDAVEQACIEIRNLMMGAADLKVDLVVDVGVGDNWDQAH